MAVGTVTAQALIQTQIQKILIDPLFSQASTFLSLGARIFQTASPISVPTISGNFSPGWISEGALIPVREGPAFDAVNLLPSTMDSLKSITILTNEVLRSSSQALDSVLQARLVSDHANMIDAWAWGSAGDGVNTPKGLLAWSGMQQLDAAGASLLPDDLLDAQAAALASNIPPGLLRFVMHPSNFSALRKLKTSDDRYLIQPDLTAGAGFVILGTPIVLTSHLPEDTTVLLDPQAIAVAIDVNPVVRLLPERYAEFDSTGIRVVTRLDFAAVQPHSIIVLTTTA